MSYRPEHRAIIRELASSPKGAEVTCASGSMEPTIPVGTVVKIHALPLEKLRIGDVLLFEAGDGAYLLHRVVLFSPGRRWFLHIGDAPTPAGPRRALCRDIVGRADLARRRPPAEVYLQAAQRLARTVWRSRNRD